jgi:hypothetical protein
MVNAATSADRSSAPARGALMLVGSVPFDTAEEVFRVFGGALGPYLATMPDGEVGDRRRWITRLHYQVFNGHPDLEVVRRPSREPGREQLLPHGEADAWQFRVRPGVERIAFDAAGWRLGYAKDAIASYFVFRTLRREGAIPAHLRFQVSMPMINSVIAPRTFPDLADLARVKPGYEAALRAELKTIVGRIPHEDLAIQWDCSWEVTDVNGGIPEFPREGAVERNLAQVRSLSPLVPPAVALGYHLCFGTFGGWPRFAPDDLARTVELANGFIAASGRRVDWLHIPTLDRIDDAFYAPLARLEPRGAKIYLGMIHNMPRFAERLAVARKYLPGFAIAAPCGFGRTPRDRMDQIVKDHLDAVALASR